jgi:hypothetical protein
MALRAPAGYRFVQGRPERPVHLIEAGRRDDAGGTTGRSLCGLWSGWSPETTSATWRPVADELPEGGAAVSGVRGPAAAAGPAGDAAGGAA